ncbi:hypothetical protein AB0M10_08665 [Streptomyces sp. NPDC051840]
MSKGVAATSGGHPGSGRDLDVVLRAAGPAALLTERDAAFVR